MTLKEHKLVHKVEERCRALPPEAARSGVPGHLRTEDSGLLLTKPVKQFQGPMPPTTYTLSTESKSEFLVFSLIVASH